VDLTAGIAEIAADSRSGATALAERAAALLTAAQSLPAEELPALCVALAKAQPAMAPLLRLANAVLLAAESHPASNAATRAAAKEFMSDLRRHAAQASRQGATVLPDGRVLTHSSSSLVAEAILGAHAVGRRIEVFCTESRPGFEGRALAARLAAAGVLVTLVVDAAAPALLSQCDLLLMGADTVCAAGLVHTVGTLGLALAARFHGVSTYALATGEKLLPRACGDQPPVPERDPDEVLPDAPPGVTPLNFYYDLTPHSLLDGIITEEGPLPAKTLDQQLDAMPVHPALAGIWRE